jgi:hypothetical protein
MLIDVDARRQDRCKSRLQMWDLMIGEMLSHRKKEELMEFLPSTKIKGRDDKKYNCIAMVCGAE